MKQEENRKKKTLEDLWYLYQIENPEKLSTEEEKLLNRLTVSEEKLRASLDKEQSEAFRNFEDCLDEISGISSKEAFIKGIRFATGYLVEAMYK